MHLKCGKVRRASFRNAHCDDQAILEDDSWATSQRPVTAKKMRLQRRQTVPGRRISIAVVMKLTAIIAVNLAVLRLLPEVWVFSLPPFLFMVMLLDLALVQTVAFGQPLRTFYFTFLIAGVLSTAVISVFAFNQPEPGQGKLHILETAIQYYGKFRGRGPVIPPYIEFPMLATADQWITCILVGVLPALTAVLASWWMRRRSARKSEWGQGAAAFLQGALIGFGLYVGVILVFAFVLAPWLPTPPEALTYVYLAGLAASPLVGGFALARLTLLRLRRHHGETP
jgi:hypothetical protein